MSFEVVPRGVKSPSVWLEKRIVRWPFDPHRALQKVKPSCKLGIMMQTKASFIKRGTVTVWSTTVPAATERKVMVPSNANWAEENVILDRRLT